MVFPKNQPQQDNILYMFLMFGFMTCHLTWTLGFFAEHGILGFEEFFVIFCCLPNKRTNVKHLLQIDPFEKMTHNQVTSSKNDSQTVAFEGKGKLLLVGGSFPQVSG